jgi:hypothetical protein
VNETVVKERGLTAFKLFSSSEKSWEMTEPINLNPMMMQPPLTDELMVSMPLACTVEGSFTSYFADKPVPRAVINKEEKNDEEGDEEIEDRPVAALDQIKSEDKKIDKGKPGKVFVIGTSDVLKNSVISQDGTNINSIFIMNLIDYLNGREDIAVMRGKTGNLNPLSIGSADSKSWIKYFNIIGLPIIVVLFGLLIWFLRHRRKAVIQEMFKK